MDEGLKDRIKVFADAKGIEAPTDFAGGEQAPQGEEGDMTYREEQITALEGKPGYDPKMLLEILIKKL